MRVEVGAPSRCLLSRRARDGPPRAAVDPVDEMDDERERGQETAVLREVRDDHGMVVVTAKLRLELSSPDVEELLRVGGEAEEWALLRGELFRLDGGEVKAGELTVDRERASPRIDVRPPIDV